MSNFEKYKKAVLDLSIKQEELSKNNNDPNIKALLLLTETLLVSSIMFAEITHHLGDIADEYRKQHQQGFAATAGGQIYTTAKPPGQ